MRHVFAVRVGPASFRIGSQWARPIGELRRLYEGYPPQDEPCDFTVRLEPQTALRRFVRPSVAIRGDLQLPGAAPLPLAHALLAAEMGMNLQMALGHRGHLLLHASAVERDGKAVLMTGHSGSGKSTLAALLGERGWRFLGDEFALLDLDDGRLHPFPRPISLKNEAVAALDGVDPARFGPTLVGTPKGILRHLRPAPEALARMDEAAAAALILFPRFGLDLESAVRPVGAAEVFARLTQASTNFVSLGEKGFESLTRLVTGVPAHAIDYSRSEEGVALVEQLWERQT